MSGIEFHKSLEVLKKIKKITESNYDDADAKKLLLKVKEEVLKLPEAVLLLI